MSSDSQPNVAPARSRRKLTVSLYWVLAVEVLIILWLKGDTWAQQFQLRAEILGVPWVVLALGWMLGLPVLYFLMITTHESGHVVGGLLARFRIQSFAANWLRIRRKATGWEIRLVKPQAKVGGMVHATPTHTNNLRSRYSLFVAGGPVANLATGALTLYLHHRLAAHSAAPLASLGSYVLLNALLIFGWLSVAVGALNLMPFKLKSGHIIDGRHLWQFLRGGAAMHQQLGMLYFQSQMYAGQRPRDWDANLVAQYATHHSNSVLDCYAHLLVYSHFLDCNNQERLLFHLNRSLDSVASAPASVQQHVLGEAAYVAAVLTQNAEHARFWLDRAQVAKPYTKEEGLVARAAVAYAEGQFSEAEQWLQLAIEQVEKCAPSGGVVQAAERLYDLRDKLQQAQQALNVTAAAEPALTT
ncbi:M50 family metallopeptidase [Hymenobacter properus]|uniref:M50 family metallopeptidase n=1 Tax=Hymenobacter properus TaxID=2791026 RepID=A0A931BN97_9BACT|nr:M50 family metallopeptidase [Hymenobacter properus]MBF9142540.1 M50 family metallopeptidase [Hymenobacter properus]MBR7721347.1 M50 family metallopeptidase [Microvirga sp. SRT04]